jgi:hypothetical protein
LLKVPREADADFVPGVDQRVMASITPRSGTCCTSPEPVAPAPSGPRVGRRILAGDGPRQGAQRPTGLGVPLLSVFTVRSADVGEATPGVIQ